MNTIKPVYELLNCLVVQYYYVCGCAIHVLEMNTAITFYSSAYHAKIFVDFVITQPGNLGNTKF